MPTKRACLRLRLGTEYARSYTSSSALSRKIAKLFLKFKVYRITTVVVDDSPVFLRTVCTFLAQYKGIEVVATTESAFEALRAVDRFRPDLVLLDFHLPLVNGLEAMAQIRCRFPATRVVILTGYDEPELRRASLEGGAFAFIPKLGVSRELPCVLARIASA